MSQSRNFEELKARLADARKKAEQAGISKAASAKPPGSPEVDPNEKGAPEAPVDPGAQPAAQHAPPNQENKAQENAELLKVTKPGGIDKSPAITTQDGNAKEDAATSPTASLDKIANNRLAGIQDRLAKLRGGKTTEKAAADTAPAPAAVVVEEEDEQVLQKLASQVDAYTRVFAAITSTEEGVETVERLLQKAAGVEAATAMLKEAAETLGEINIAAAQEIEMMKAAAAQEDAFNYLWAQATPEQQAAMVKCASVHNLALDGIEDELEKLAYMQGAEDAAAMEEGGGELPGAESLEEAPPSPEELLQMLQMLVESGEITEEDAAQIAQLVMGEGGAGGGGMPSPEEEAMKQASIIFDEVCGK